LLVAGHAPNLFDGAELAARAIDSGAAGRVLHALVRRTNLPVVAEAAR